MQHSKDAIHQQATKNLLEISRQLYGNDIAEEAYTMALSPVTRVVKFQKLQKLTQKLSDIASPITACASGCSYCCYQATSVSEVEARAISKLTGRRYLKPEDTDVFEDRKKYEGVPCTFLVNGKCSIYSERPIICRTHINASNVVEICKVGSGTSQEVPYLDTSVLTIPIGLICGVEFHDIRDWFPKELS